MKRILMTRLSVCSLGVSCNEMIDTPMLLVVIIVAILEFRCNIAMVHFEEHSIKKLLIEHYNL